MPLFEVAIIEEPTQKEIEDGGVEKLVMKPTAVLANDEQTAAINAVMDSKNLEVDRNKMKVLVRPFG